MINITKKILISGNRIIAEIFADNLPELLNVNNIEGYELSQSSIAYVISSGEIYVMGEDRKWYNTNGKEATNGLT